jgi:predicted metallo-beta-lactamase superfamily hydrolase
LTGAGSIKFIPLAAESLGVRSMCTYVETPDFKVLIDAGASLGFRFRLLPHPREYEALVKCREKIVECAGKVEVVTISHYHFDHVTPTYTDYTWNFSSLEVARQIYGGKIVLAKDFRSDVNASQRRRGWIFRKTVEDSVEGFKVADGEAFTFGETKLKFSKPVFHGEVDTPLGWVLMLTVEHGDDMVMHASDVQGPISDETLKAILKVKPRLVYVGGPPLYLADFRVKRSVVNHGLQNIAKLVEDIDTVIIDHHLLRAEGWRESLQPVFKVAEEKGHEIMTAAEFLGLDNNLLEYRRRKLYEVEPPSSDFIRWTKLPKQTRRKTIPQI